MPILNIRKVVGGACGQQVEKCRRSLRARKSYKSKNIRVLWRGWIGLTTFCWPPSKSYRSFPPFLSNFYTTLLWTLMHSGTEFWNVLTLSTNPSRTFSQKLGMQGHGWLERRTSHTSVGACLIRGPVHFDQHIILFFRSYSIWAVVPNFLWSPILEQTSA